MILSVETNQIPSHGACNLLIRSLNYKNVTGRLVQIDYKMIFKDQPFTNEYKTLKEQQVLF